MSETLIKVRIPEQSLSHQKGAVLSRTVGYVYAVDGVESSPGQPVKRWASSANPVAAKTTAGMAVMGLIPITSGKVWFEGQRDMSKMSNWSGLRAAAAKDAADFQDPYSSLNPRMTVNEILADPMDVHGIYTGASAANGWRFCWKRWGWRRSRAAATPTNFPAASDSGSALPAPWPWIRGHHRRRTGLGPGCLHPGPDHKSAQKLKREFDLSLMIISHDLAVVEYICDRILVMYLGKVMETAPFAAIVRHAQAPYTQALLSAAPVSDPLSKKSASCFKAMSPARSIRQAAAGFIPAAPSGWRYATKKNPKPPISATATRPPATCTPALTRM
jgi:hypothetical protein